MIDREAVKSDQINGSAIGHRHVSRLNQRTRSFLGRCVPLTGLPRDCVDQFLLALDSIETANVARANGSTRGRPATTFPLIVTSHGL